MKPAISVENLGKSYRVSHRTDRKGYRTLRESLAGIASAPLRRLRGAGNVNETSEEFWALKDVSFDISPGEVVGIIGRNGAGKSTLLKLLSRITKPSVGQVSLSGRVGSLLEVGTGFHPELTGRENIYLNGSILGMSRSDIRRRFDEIVDFAEVGKFLETPVKRYSSGMYVRLAFAVASHLEPEILLVDEVLAVGDIAFQQKCLDRMRTVSRRGRAVLFVSHHMASIAALCTRAIRIDGGLLVDEGPAAEQVARYMASLYDRSDTSLENRMDRSGTGAARLTAVRFRDRFGHEVDQIMCGEPVTFEITYRAPRRIASPSIHLAIYNDMGAPVTYLSTTFSGDTIPPLAEGQGRFICQIPELAIVPGTYVLNIDLQSDGVDADHIPAAAKLLINPGPFYPSGRTPPSSYGYVLCRHRWSVQSEACSANSVLHAVNCR